MHGDESVGEGSWLDDFGLAWEALGNDAPRVIKERDLRLHATIFTAGESHVRILQNGVAAPTNSPNETWTRLEAEFLKNGFSGESEKPASLTKTSLNNEAVIGGECGAGPPGSLESSS